MTSIVPPTPAVPTAPYGAWSSPISADAVAAGGVSLREVHLDGSDVYWLEGRSAEAGRQVVVRREADGRTSDVSPAGVNVRNRVHEYGGGAYVVGDGRVWYSDFSDGRIYEATETGALAATPAGARRYADLVLDRARRRLVCVQEDHSPETLAEHGEARNTLVAVSLDGEAPVVLVEGNDFYAAPRISPDGSHLAWLTWNHPDMPWDQSELWVGEIGQDGRIAAPRLVAGGPGESICQPRWSPDGVLHYVSDRSGWWNLERLVGPGNAPDDRQPILPMEAEFAGPDWVFGLSSYGFTPDGTILAVAHQAGHDLLLRIERGGAEAAVVETPAIRIDSIQVGDGRAVFVAGFAAEPAALVTLAFGSGALETIRRSRDQSFDAGFISTAEPISFPSTDGRVAHGLYYPPRNRDVTAPAGSLPPLIVQSHGGPTAAASPAFQAGIQFFTSRGFAFLDVDYGGSTGYGRTYRTALEGQWGIVDVDDCVNGALALVARGLVDRDRLAITGGSAGGYTTLAALTFRDVFRAGASYFGIGDLETFVKETHKFESRYIDRLVGPYPETADRYRERSPVHFTDRISCPMLILQGLDDRVVPPAQAEQMVEALRAKGLPYAAIMFPGEDHGFRQAANIRRSLEAELSFYGQVFGFVPSDSIEPVKVENLPG